jgi:holo-[acyl-carrier protein] synthase
MAIVGIGVDVVEIERVRAALAHATRGDRFKRRVFTAGEQAYCDARKGWAQSYAARFAAKEAVMKALGASGPWGFPWLEIEVVSVESGVPGIRLSGDAAARAVALGAARVHVSLSHDRKTAVAQAIAEGDRR